MNLFIEHDAATLARLTGSKHPNCQTIIVKHGDISTVLASSHAGNPLSGNWLVDLDVPGDRILCWSGTLADELFDSDPRTWGRSGREALGRFCDEVTSQLKAHDRTLCFHPHARHVINDVPSCLTFLRSRDGQPFEVALAPASLLEPSMMDRVDEHLQRQFESLGGNCGMVLLCDVRVAGDDDGQRCEPAVLGEGLMRRDLIRSLLRDHVPAETPIVIDGRHGGTAIARQMEWLCG